MGNWLVNWGSQLIQSVGWMESRAVGLEVGLLDGTLLGRTESPLVPQEVTLSKSLHVEPTDFQSNKPNYCSTDQPPIGLPMQPTNFPSNRLSFSWTD